MILTGIHEAILLTSPQSSTLAASAAASSLVVAPSPRSDDTRWQPSATAATWSAHAWLLDDNNNQATAIQQPPSSSIYISSQSFAGDNDEWTQQLLQIKNHTTTDKVKRIIDTSTILLEKSGTVSLDVVRGAGSTYILPECCTYAPAYKLKQLLKRDTQVKVVNLMTAAAGGGGNDSNNASSSSARPRVWIIRSQDDLNINRELLRSGFGFVRKGSTAATTRSIDSSNFDYESMMKDMTTLEETARSEGIGIFKVCGNNNNNDNSDENNGDTITTSNFIAEFEPMEYTTEIKYGDDGGKSVLVSNKSDKETSSLSSIPPSNPGDVKGCSDFGTYEDALGYYERYYPYYGDVAKLDRDGDGVPCPGLPHTSNQDRYRMKRPK